MFLLPLILLFGDLGLTCLRKYLDSSNWSDNLDRWSFEFMTLSYYLEGPQILANFLTTWVPYIITVSLGELVVENTNIFIEKRWYISIES